jgi:hypothetical protein
MGPDQRRNAPQQGYLDIQKASCQQVVTKEFYIKNRVARGLLHTCVLFSLIRLCGQGLTGGCCDVCFAFVANRSASKGDAIKQYSTKPLQGAPSRRPLAACRAADMQGRGPTGLGRHAARPPGKATFNQSVT